MITSILNETPGIRIAWKCLETVDGVACRHTGAAKDIFVLKLPITKNIGELLFAHISVSGHLAKGHRGQTREVEIAATEDDENLGTNLITVSSDILKL